MHLSKATLLPVQEVQRIRQFEFVVITAAFGLYVIHRVRAEAGTLEALLAKAQAHFVPAEVLARDLADYDPVRNAALPLAAGSLLLLAGWLLLHYRVVPRLRPARLSPRLLLLVGLTVLLLALSVFVYHYFTRYVRFRFDRQGTIIGLKIYSWYGKRVVLSEVVGLAVLLGIYELAARFYYYLHGQLSAEYGRSFRYSSYLLLAALGGAVLALASRIALPVFVWQIGAPYLLPAGGLVLQVYLLQHYLYASWPRDQAPFARMFIVKLLACLLVAFVGTIVLWGAHEQWRHVRGWGEPVLVLFSLAVFFTGITIYLRRALLREQRQLQTQVSTQSARLESLRAQINPHFLFNALNTLYASALKENSEQTAEGIRKLAEMMRFMLEENHQQYIPLHKEVEYLHNYIQIQRLRLDESQDIDIRVNLQEPGAPIRIAPMLLSPLVENAFKHGISLEHRSWIYITLTLDEEKLYFKVHNSLHRKTGAAPGPERTGVGLENVQKRLSLLYPAAHQLMIQRSAQDYFVSLTLQFGTGKPDAER